MEQRYFYSPSTNCFYLDGVNTEIPKDAFETTLAKYNECLLKITQYNSETKEIEIVEQNVENTINWSSVAINLLAAANTLLSDFDTERNYTEDMNDLRTATLKTQDEYIKVATDKKALSDFLKLDEAKQIKKNFPKLKYLSA